MRPLRVLLLAFVLLLSLVAGTAGASEPTPVTTCVRVPVSGELAPGSTASSPVEYGSTWRWSAASAGQRYRWSLVDASGGTVMFGQSDGSAGSLFLWSAGSYRWRVLNGGTVGQHWTLCVSS